MIARFFDDPLAILEALTAVENVMDQIDDGLAPVRATDDPGATSIRGKRSHLKWMCREIRSLLARSTDTASIEKATNALLFVEGALWGLGEGGGDILPPPFPYGDGGSRGSSPRPSPGDFGFVVGEPSLASFETLLAEAKAHVEKAWRQLVGKEITEADFTRTNAMYRMLVAAEKVWRRLEEKTTESDRQPARTTHHADQQDVQCAVPTKKKSVLTENLVALRSRALTAKKHADPWVTMALGDSLICPGWPVTWAHVVASSPRVVLALLDVLAQSVAVPGDAYDRAILTLNDELHQALTIEEE